MAELLASWLVVKLPDSFTLQCIDLPNTRMVYQQTNPETKANTKGGERKRARPNNESNETTTTTKNSFEARPKTKTWHRDKHIHNDKRRTQRNWDTVHETDTTKETKATTKKETKAKITHETIWHGHKQKQRKRQRQRLGRRQIETSIHVGSPNIPSLRIPWVGNPRAASCFFDEGLNRDLAQMARSSHSHNLERDVIARSAIAHSRVGLPSPFWERLFAVLSQIKLMPTFPTHKAQTRTHSLVKAMWPYTQKANARVHVSHRRPTWSRPQTREQTCKQL